MVHGMQYINIQRIFVEKYRIIRKVSGIIPMDIFDHL